MVTFSRGFKEGLVSYQTAQGSERKEADMNPWGVFYRTERECFAAMVTDRGDGRDLALQLVNMGITVTEPTVVCRDFMSAVPVIGTYDEVLGLGRLNHLATYRKMRGSG